MGRQTIYTEDCTPRFHGSYDVEKLGGKKEKILAVGYVPGAGLHYLKDGTLITDCPGTCGYVDCSQCGSRDICYAMRDFFQYVDYSRNCIENTLQIREDMAKHFADLRAEIVANDIDVLRYTQSGEIESCEQFLQVVSIAEDLGTDVYLYTKNYDVLYRFFDVDGRELPETMTVLISIWGKQGVAEYEHFKHHAGIKAFVVNNDEIKADAQCPAYREQTDEKGRTRVRLVKEDWAKCGNCKLCTRSRSCKVIRCLEHK